MKILYVSDTDLDKTSGIAQKVLMHSDQWVAQGHEVLLVSLESLSLFSLNGERFSKPKIDIKRRGWKIFVHLLLSSWRLKKIIQGIGLVRQYIIERHSNWL